MYKLLNNLMTGQTAPFILRTADNAYIPFNNDNVDYQKYLEWVSQGNQPEPADE